MRLTAGRLLDRLETVNDSRPTVWDTLRPGSIARQTGLLVLR